MPKKRFDIVYTDASKSMVASVTVYDQIIQNKETFQNYIETGESYQKLTLLNGERHSFADEPASIINDSSHEQYIKSWYNNGRLHREDDKPAMIRLQKYSKLCFSITSCWFYNGNKHREEKPATITIVKNKKDDKLLGFRKIYYHFGKCFRPNSSKPSDARVIFSDTMRGFVKYDKSWTNESGKPHRLNGPALICVDSNSKSVQWMINNMVIDKDEYFSFLDENNIDIKRMSEKDKALVLLKFG